MDTIYSYIQGHPVAAWIVLAASFALLAKCADLFVEGSVGIADRFNVPKIVIGIVLVSIATSSPELAVSMSASLKGNPEMALGNAIGSVICDDGLALAAAGLTATTAIAVSPLALKTSGIALLCIEAIAFLFVIPDNTLSRFEGLLLVVLICVYLFLLLRFHKKGRFKNELEIDLGEMKKAEQLTAMKMVIFFVAGLGGIILASNFIVVSAETIALSLGIPNGIISLVLVAFGTSIPEVATSITAVRKNHGSLAFGNVIGSDLMNICVVGGASAMVNDLTLPRGQLLFMFPSALIISTVMLLLIKKNYTITRTKGMVLLGLYVLYLICSFALFPPG